MMAARTLTYALVASLAANAVLGWSWLGQRDAATAAQLQRDQARGDASACSDAVEDLRTLADQRASEAKAARAEAAAKAKSHNQKADTILATPPAVPGDDCRSAQLRIGDWLNGRSKP